MSRRKDLTEKRDRAIVERFHELYDKKRMRIDDVLSVLGNEVFFLMRIIFMLEFSTTKQTTPITKAY